MLAKLKQLIGSTLGAEAEKQAQDPGRALQLATAALLVEVSQADYDGGGQSEIRLIRQLLRGHFELGEQESEALLDAAQGKSLHSVSLHDFTRTLHDALEPEEKLAVVEMLWQVAFADRQLDKYEDHVVRKVADLLYVPHADLMRLRNEVRGRMADG